MISAGKVEIKVTMELGQRVLQGKGMPDVCQTRALLPSCTEKDDVRNDNAYGRVKLLKYPMNIVERVLTEVKN